MRWAALAVLEGMGRGGRRLCPQAAPWGLAGPGGAWWGLVGPGGAWRGMAGPGGAWWGLAGHGGAWWGLAGPGGAWLPRQGHCGRPWRFQPPAAEEVAGDGSPVCGICFRGSHPAQPDLRCPLEMCGRFISTNFLSTKCI